MRILPLCVLRSAIWSVATVALTVFSVVSPAFSQIPSSTWVQLNPSRKPLLRAACTMVYDPVSQKTVMFGGFTRSRYLNDTWTFDGTNWKRIRTAVKPAARAAASAAYDTTLKQVVLFGGYNGQYLNDTWMWNGATSTWTRATPAHQPVPATLPMLFLDPVSGRVDEFGGYDGMFYQLTTWRWKDGAWHKLFLQPGPSAPAAAA